MGAHLLGGKAGQRHALGQQPGRGQQAGSGAAGGAQDLDGRRTAVRAREGPGKVQDAVHVRAAERVDRLVGVAEGDEGAAAPGEGVQQPYLSRVGVLVLVDEYRVVLRGEPPGDLGAAGEEDGTVDQFGVVEYALQIKHVEVLGEEGGRGAPVGAAYAAGEVVQSTGAQAQFTAAGEDRADLVGEAAGGQAGAQVVRPAHVREAEPFQVGLAREQLTDGDVLFRAGQQPEGLHEQVGVLVGADQGVAERVEGGRLRRARRPDAQRHAVPQLDGRLAAERQHEHARGVTAPGDPRRHRLDERGGLAGARTCENEQWAGGVVNHGTLCCVKTRGVRAGRRGTHQSVSATVPLSPLRVRQTLGGGRGAHVVRRSWWVCCWDVLRAWRTVIAG